MNTVTTVHVVGAAIVEDGRCLAALRGPSMHLAGKWEFPGGKIKSDECAQQALVRELREELSIEARIGDWLGRGEVVENGRCVCLDVYLCEADTHALILHEHAAVKWLEADDIYELDWAAADIPILALLAAYLRGAS